MIKMLDRVSLAPKVAQLKVCCCTYTVDKIDFSSGTTFPTTGKHRVRGSTGLLLHGLVKWIFFLSKEHANSNQHQLHEPSPCG